MKLVQDLVYNHMLNWYTLSGKTQLPYSTKYSYIHKHAVQLYSNSITVAGLTYSLLYRIILKYCSFITFLLVVLSCWSGNCSAIELKRYKQRCMQNHKNAQTCEVICRPGAQFTCSAGVLVEHKLVFFAGSARPAAAHLTFTDHLQETEDCLCQPKPLCGGLQLVNYLSVVIICKFLRNQNLSAWVNLPWSVLYHRVHCRLIWWWLLCWARFHHHQSSIPCCPNCQH